MAYPGLHVALLLTLLAIAAASDVACRRVPNWLAVAIGSAGVAVQLAANGPRPALGAVLLALALAAALVAPWRIGWMGGGDLKLAVAVACWLSPAELARFLLASALAGAVVGAPQLAELLGRRLAGVGPAWTSPRGAGRRQVPFGAALAIGGALAVLWRGP